MRIGIDVGGTNTDAVVLDAENRVLATTKAPTSADVTGGIRSAVRTLLARLEQPIAVEAVMIGTTHFLNALIERRRLSPVAAVRLGLPATSAIPPMTDWPAELREVLGASHYLCHGGREFDGRELSRVDSAELKRTAGRIAESGFESVAISSVFSPAAPEDEQYAAELLRAELGDVDISLSHEIGRIGLLARENATIINASLRELARTIVDSFGTALADAGIEAPIFLSQNDGTLMNVGQARRYPVATFASGPTNSMRGAAFLSGLPDCAVVDVGGTTTDIGMLGSGFPRIASNETRIAGVRTNFPIPDVYSIGLGGGSLIAEDGTAGPRSVGYQLETEARVFGGETLTATDLAAACGRAEIGDRARVSQLDQSFVERALAGIAERVDEGIDRMRTSAAQLPVVLVGGGSVLIPERLPNFSEVHRPDHFPVANAVGAAIAQVSGLVDGIYRIGERDRESVLAEARAEAIDKAERAGARGGTVEIVDIQEVPLAYLPGNATRIHVKAVGELAVRKEEPSRA